MKKFVIFFLVTVTIGLRLPREIQKMLDRVLDMDEDPVGDYFEHQMTVFAEPLAAFDDLPGLDSGESDSEETAVGKSVDDLVADDLQDMFGENEEDMKKEAGLSELDDSSSVPKTVDIPGRNCCMDMTADCQACLSDMSVHQYCAQKPAPSLCSKERLETAENNGNCACVKTWRFLGLEYEGCDERAPKDDKPWCYVSGGDSCPDARKSTVEHGSYWRYCDCKKDNAQDDSTEPMSMPPVVNTVVHVASEKAPEPGYRVPSPKVISMPKISDSKMSDNTDDVPEMPDNTDDVPEMPDNTDDVPEDVPEMPETKQEQTQCKCKASWNFKGKPFEGCDVRKPNEEVDWCPVRNPSDCDDVKEVSEDHDEPWIYCRKDKHEMNEPCRCSDEWLWKGKSYQRCDSRAPDDPQQRKWCYVQGKGECKDAKDSVPNPGFFWRFCGDRESDKTSPVVMDVNPAAQKISDGDCSCKGSWEYKGLTYTGCDSRKPDDNEPWCFVNGGADCDGVSPSKVVEGEFYRPCTPDATGQAKEASPPEPKTKDASGPPEVSKETPEREGCSCKDDWVYKGDDYKHCDMRMPDDKERWCFVKDVNCPEAKPSKVEPNEKWKYCGMEDQEPMPPGSLPVNPDKQAPGKVCSCQASWEWKGMTYQGCDERKPEAKTPWCYIDGDEECDGAQKSTVDPTKLWKRCEPGDDFAKDVKELKSDTLDSAAPVAPNTSPECTCQDSWVYKEVEYHVCDSRAPDDNKPWCYVKGGAECSKAQESKENPGFFSRPCLDTTVTGKRDCTCQDSWRYKEVDYVGCDPRKPDADDAWCFIHGDLSCPGAEKSSHIQDAIWKLCSALEETQDVPEDPEPPKSKIPAESVTPALTPPSHPDATPATQTSPGGAGCTCKDSWEWQEEIYHGCDERMPEAKSPWCYVEGNEDDCPDSQESSHFPGKFWRRCDATSDTSTPASPDTSNSALPEPHKPAKKQQKVPVQTKAPITGSGDAIPAAAKCKCQSSWVYKKETYKGCDARKPDADKDWCYINGDISCPSALESTQVENAIWKHCTEADNPKGTNAAKAAGQEAPADKECKCKISWSYKGAEFKGCDPAVPDSDVPWCYINGGLECEGAEHSLQNEGQYFKKCTPTDVVQDTPPSGQSAETPALPATPAETPALPASPAETPASPATPAETAPVTPPSKTALEAAPASKACKCKITWTYKEKTYNGCDPAMPDAQEHWCFINGDMSCAGAQPSKVVDGALWKTCTPADVVAGTPSEVTPPGQPGAAPAESKCHCQTSWVYKEETYKGCDSTMPDADVAWCFINGDASCPSAKPSKVVEGAFWKECTPSDQDADTPPTATSEPVKKKANVKPPTAQVVEPAAVPPAQAVEPASAVVPASAEKAAPKEKACKCKVTWSYKKKTYNACDPAAPDAQETWCYINGDMSCPGAKQSTDIKDAIWKVCTPAADDVPGTPAEKTPPGQPGEAPPADKCRCQTSWTYKKETYKGCDGAMPDAKEPWCFINGNESCPGAKPSTVVEGAFWKACSASDVVDGTPITATSKPAAGKPPVSDTPVTPALTPPVTPAAPKKALTPETGPAPASAKKAAPLDKACKCKVTWSYKKKTYNACDPNMPDAKEPWCYINGDKSCPGAKESSHVKDSIWKVCSEADNVAGTPNAKTPPGQPGPAPDTSKCKCQSSWIYKEQTYKGCDPAMPGAKEPWCFINGDASCEGATPSKVVEGSFFKLCGSKDVEAGTPMTATSAPGANKPPVAADAVVKTPVTPANKPPVTSAKIPPATPASASAKETAPAEKVCKCKKSWIYDKVEYHDCDARKPKAKETWCYINGDMTCDGAKASLENKASIWKVCTEADVVQTVPGAIDQSKCKCQSSWVYDKETYKGCDPKHPGAETPWCYINGDMSCPGAKTSKENQGAVYKECTPMDVEAGTPATATSKPGPVATPEPKPTTSMMALSPAVMTPAPITPSGDAKKCKCKVSWVFQKEQYKGCDARHPGAEHNWCYINGGAECPASQESKEVKGAFWKKCTAADVVAGETASDVPADSKCKCQETWAFEKDTFNGCDARHPGAERPWCYINGDMSCAGALQSDSVKGAIWMHCEPSGASIPESSAPVTPATSPASTTPAGKTCECQDTWMWDGKEYKGCDAGMPDSKHAWCYVKDGCRTSQPSTKEPGKNWAYCDVCDCKNEWMWKGTTYNSCDARKPDDAAPWCYVQGGDTCAKARESKAKDGNFYRTCDDCECQSAWNFEGKTYIGCDPNAPGAKKPWCPVVGGDSCSTAEAASGTRTQKWKYCGPGANTPFVHPETVPGDMKKAIDTAKIENVPKAASAKAAPATPAAVVDPMVAADACDCQPEWPWKGKTYKECDPAHPDDPSPWCMVKDSSCKDAKPSNESPGSSWRYCAASGCPGSSVTTQSINGLNNVNLQCDKFTPLDGLCRGVQKHLQELASQSKIRMAELKTLAPTLYHAACKNKDGKPNWWDNGDNRPQKAPSNECLQASSCLSMIAERGPKFIASPTLCGGKGVQFKYNVKQSSPQKVFEFMDRQDFKIMKPLMEKHRSVLETQYSPELVAKHMASFADGTKVDGETVKFIMDMFKIPGYFSTEVKEVCLENTVLRDSLETGVKVFEDDHVVTGRRRFRRLFSRT